MGAWVSPTQIWPPKINLCLFKFRHNIASSPSKNVNTPIEYHIRFKLCNPGLHHHPPHISLKLYSPLIQSQSWNLKNLQGTVSTSFIIFVARMEAMWFQGLSFDFQLGIVSWVCVDIIMSLTIVSTIHSPNSEHYAPRWKYKIFFIYL